MHYWKFKDQETFGDSVYICRDCNTECMQHSSGTYYLQMPWQKNTWVKDEPECIKPEKEEPLSCVQSYLCGLLDDLGGDGTTAALNRVLEDDLIPLIINHVKWLERRAELKGYGDAAEQLRIDHEDLVKAEEGKL